MQFWFLVEFWKGKRIMEGRNMDYAVSGYKTIADHATSSNQILWMSAVFGGIIMCKTVSSIAFNFVYFTF